MQPLAQQQEPQQQQPQQGLPQPCALQPVLKQEPLQQESQQQHSRRRNRRHCRAGSSSTNLQCSRNIHLALFERAQLRNEQTSSSLANVRKTHAGNTLTACKKCSRCSRCPGTRHHHRRHRVRRPQACACARKGCCLTGCIVKQCFTHHLRSLAYSIPFVVAEDLSWRAFPVLVSQSSIDSGMCKRVDMRRCSEMSRALSLQTARVSALVLSCALYSC